MYPKELYAKLKNFGSEAKKNKTEKGINTLYMAFGFLEWYESEVSNDLKLSPLLLMEVKITDYKDNFTIKNDGLAGVNSIGEPITDNMLLNEKLKDFHLTLPTFNKDDIDGNTVINYINKVADIIKDKPRWKVRNYVIIGHFSFLNLVMYKDLNLKNWEKIFKEDNYLINAFFKGKVNDIRNNNSCIDIDREVETVRNYAPLLITDADSSQHTAIVEALKGENLIIKGPPGTGKSQTIINLIANALYNGKKVLFVAQKKAALDVVFSRLKNLGLVDYCFELHSEKIKKDTIIEAFDSRLKKYTERFEKAKNVNDNIDNEFIEKSNFLRDYYDLLQIKTGNLDRKLFDIVWNIKNLEQYVKNYPFDNIDIPNVMEMSEYDFKNNCKNLDKLEESFNSCREIGVNIKDIVDNIEICDVKNFNINDLFEKIKNCNLYITELKNILYSEEMKDYNQDKNTINNVESFATNIQNINELINNFDYNLEIIKNFKSKNDVNQLSIFIEKINDYRIKFKKVNLISEKTELIFENIENIKNILNKPNNFEKTITLEELTDRKNILENEIKNLNSNDELEKIASIIFGKQDVSVAEIISTQNILEIFINVYKFFPKYINDNSLTSYNVEIINNINIKLNEIKTKKEELVDIFNFSNFDIEDLNLVFNLNEVKIEFSNSNLFSFIYNSKYRKTKKFYKSIISNKKIKFSKKNIIDNCDKLIDLFENIKNFNNDIVFSNVLGEHLKGLDTKIDEIVSVVEFYTILQNKLLPYIKDNYNDEISLKLKSFFIDLKNKEDIIKIINILESYRFDYKISESILKDNLFNNFNLNFKLNEYLIYLNNNLDFIENLNKTTNFIFIDKSIKLEEIIDIIAIAEEIIKLEAEINEQSKIVKNILPNFNLNLDSDLNLLSKIADLVKSIFNIELIDPLKIIDIIVNSNIKNMYEITININFIINNLKQKIEQINKFIKINTLKVFNADNIENSNLNLLYDFFDKILNNKELFRRIIIYFDDFEKIEDIGFSEIIFYFLKNKKSSDISYLFDDKKSLKNLSKIYSYIIFKKLVNECTEGKWNSNFLNNLDSLIKDITKLNTDKYENNIKRLIAKLDTFEAPLGNNSSLVKDKTELQLINHQVIPNSRAIPMRSFILKAGRAIQALKPCFMMSPFSVAQYISPDSVKFDLLIIDEASQIFTEEALGSIFRSKQIVVVGDENQLPPTTFFKKTATIEEDDYENEDSTDKISLLDLCEKRGFKSKNLLWHYRSKDPSLIIFSNKYFYNNELKIFPSPIESKEILGIERKYINGNYLNNQNIKEADAIIEEIKQFVIQHPDKSLGIATINNKQSSLLEEKMNLLLSENEFVKAYVEKWDQQLESFFIKNLENVQGDERDYIFISTVYGARSEGERVMQRFGPINGKYGARRLNVLFTRAKYGLKLFTSLKSTDIVINEEKNSNGLKIFKNYLIYTETNKLELGKETNRDFDSEFEKSVYSILIGAGYNVSKQVGVEGFYIDLAVRHPKNNNYYILGIECDGAPYHSSQSARDSDIIRESVLKNLGWNIYRIWSTDWYHNREYEVERLLNEVEKLCKNDDLSININ